MERQPEVPEVIEGENLPEVDELQEVSRLAREMQEALARLPDTMTRSVSDRTAASILQAMGPLLSHLEGRLESVENTIVDQESAQKSLWQTNIGALNIRLEMMERRLDMVQRAISEPRANDTEHFLDALNARFNAIVMLIERLERRFRTIEDVLIEVDQRTQERMGEMEAHLMAEATGGDADRRRTWWPLPAPAKRGNGPTPAETSEVLPRPAPRAEPLSVVTRRENGADEPDGKPPTDTSVMPIRKP